MHPYFNKESICPKQGALGDVVRTAHNGLIRQTFQCMAQEATLMIPRRRSFPNQDLPWNKDLWVKKGEKKFPEWLRWFMFAMVAALFVLCIVEAIQGK